MDADRVEIIRRDNAGGALGAGRRCPGVVPVILETKGVEERGIVFEIEKVGPGERVASWSPRGFRERHQALLMDDRGVGAEEQAFDPAEDGGVGADG